MAFRMAYFGIRVRDMDESIRFYTEVLGMRLVERDRTPPTNGEVATLKSEGSEQLLELNYYEPGTRFGVPYTNGEDLDHIGFEVEDLRETIEDLRAKGIRVVVEPFSIGGWAEAYVEDPNGIWIELLGR